MKRRPSGLVLCAMCAVWLSASDGNGTESPPYADRTAASATSSGDDSEQATPSDTVAESIIAKEEAASGRPFDPAFRARARRTLRALPLDVLESQIGREGLLPRTLGYSLADLLYTPLPPCRVLDTRLAGGRIEAGTSRSFLVTGTDLSAQGGSATGCNVPTGATAAMLNFVAVNPAGPGDLRVTPFGSAIPLASFLNYAFVPGLNIANGLAVTLCDPAGTTCSSDLTIQADVSATDLVADVQGYFRTIETDPLPTSSAEGVVIPPAGANPVQVTGLSFPAKSYGQVLVRARGSCQIGPAGAITDDAIELAIGTTGTDAFNASINPSTRWGILRIPVNSGSHQLMFTAERVWPTGRGFIYTLGLFGRHAVGSVPDACSATLVVERQF